MNRYFMFLTSFKVIILNRKTKEYLFQNGDNELLDQHSEFEFTLQWTHNQFHAFLIFVSK